MKLVILKQGRPVREVPLDRDYLLLGRSRQCDVLLTDDPLISRKHARLQRLGDSWSITDLGSTNGTFVNGRRLPPNVQHPLRPGDKVQLGNTVLILQASYRAPSQAATVEKIQIGESAVRQVHPVYAMPFIVNLFVLGMGAVLMALGALLPWIKVVVAMDVGINTWEQVYTFSGFDGVGRLIFILALISTLILVFDAVARHWGTFVGAAHIFMALLAGAIMAFEGFSYYQMAHREVIFGIRLVDLLRFIEQFADVRIVIQTGLYLTVLGIILLLIGGLTRLLIALTGTESAG